MPFKKTKSSSAQLHKLIKAEIVGSGLKVGSGLFKALDGYAKYHKLKGDKAKMAKVYLAAGAIRIAKPKKGTFSFKTSKSMITPDFLKAMVGGIHIPKYLNDPCIKAAEEFSSIEKRRRKGTTGMLTPGLSKYLDKLKT
jgi:hypothetical protein